MKRVLIIVSILVELVSLYILLSSYKQIHSVIIIIVALFSCLISTLILSCFILFPKEDEDLDTDTYNHIGSILSDNTIRELLSSGEITITNIDPEDIQPASVDIKISNDFLRMEKHDKPVKFGEEVDYVRVTVSDNEWFTIKSGEFVLATTKSYIKIPNYITSWVEGRSSVGRFGLFTQNAGWIDPGFEGEITLELYNATDHDIQIKPNQVLVQLIFARLDKKAINSYNGRYQGQKGATGSRQHINIKGGVI